MQNGLGLPVQAVNVTLNSFTILQLVNELNRYGIYQKGTKKNIILDDIGNHFLDRAVIKSW